MTKPRLDMTKTPASVKSRWLQNIMSTLILMVLVILGSFGGAFVFASVNFMYFGAIAMLALVVEVISVWYGVAFLITHIRLTDTELYLQFMNKEGETVERTIPLSELGTRLKLRYGRNSKRLKLTLLHNGEAVVVQRMCERWSNAEIWSVYTEIKSLKKEALGREDERLKRLCVENRLW